MHPFSPTSRPFVVPQINSGVNVGQCLVAWEQICKPEIYGGLGVKSLKLHGLALRTRWEWLRRTDPTRPWQGLPMLKDEDAISVFRSLAHVRIGRGDTILFWRDRWIDGETVRWSGAAGPI